MPEMDVLAGITTVPFFWQSMEAAHSPPLLQESNSHRVQEHLEPLPRFDLQVTYPPPPATCNLSWPLTVRNTLPVTNGTSEGWGQLHLTQTWAKTLP